VKQCYPLTGLANRWNLSASSDSSTASGNPKDNLASCLALLARQSPDLALLVKVWDTLPDPVRAGIVAMVKAASASESKEAL
jgi:hypothetical protein